MTDGSAAAAGHGQLFTAAEQAALRDFWPVYEANLDAINEATMAAAASDPDLRKLIAGQDPAQAAAEQERSTATLRAGMLDGIWEPFTDNLRMQGGAYAQQGLSFKAWLLLISAAQAEMLRHVHRAYGAEPERQSAVVAALSRFLIDATLGIIGEAYLQAREDLIQQQQQAIRELSTPVLPLQPGLLLLPVVGVIDTERARQLTEQLLEGIRTNRARVVVIDLTGVPAVDSAVANHLLQTVRAAGLLGAGAIVTGLSTANALTLTRIGVDLSGLRTTSDLQRGIEEATQLLRSLSHAGVEGV
jgi:anti-anti-sigma regulatory factor